jgi:hypothetical protein
MICGQCRRCHRPPTRVTTHKSLINVLTTSPFLPPPPKIDDKTIKRLQNVKSAPHKLHTLHLLSLLPDLFSPPCALSFYYHDHLAIFSWPVVLAAAGGGLVRELYRELVRQSPLGKEEKFDWLLGMLTACFISCSTHLIPMFQMLRCIKRSTLASSTLPVWSVFAGSINDGRWWVLWNLRPWRHHCS